MIINPNNYVSHELKILKVKNPPSKKMVLREWRYCTFAQGGLKNNEIWNIGILEYWSTGTATK